MSIKLEDQLPTLLKKRRFSEAELAAMKEHEQWEDSDEKQRARCREEWSRAAE